MRPEPQGWKAQLSLRWVCGVGPHPTYWETQAISSSVLNTIWLVLLLWTTSPFTRQQIFKLCGSENVKVPPWGSRFPSKPSLY